MTKLSDTQAVVLSAAVQRADLSVLPLPDSLTLKGGALNKVMNSLRNRGLIRVIGGDGGPERVVITSEGMAAIGVEDEGPVARRHGRNGGRGRQCGLRRVARQQVRGRGEAGEVQAGQGQKGRDDRSGHQ